MNTYKSQLKALSLSAAVIALTAGTAHATTPIYTGGGTFAYSSLRAASDCAGVPLNGEAQSSACTTPSANGYEYLYAQVGSGLGLYAFLNEASPSAPTSSFSINQDSGNGYTYGPTGYAKWMFTDSDAPLDSVQTEVNSTAAVATFQNPPAIGKGTWLDVYNQTGVAGSTTSTKFKRGNAWQLPEAVAPVTVPYNLGGTTFTTASSVTGVSNQLNLSKDMLCYIWTGANSLGVALPNKSGATFATVDATGKPVVDANGVATTLTAGWAPTWQDGIFYATYNTKPKVPVQLTYDSNIKTLDSAITTIKPYHRPDGSGSTYLFTLWLSINCKGYTAAGYSAPSTVVTWPSWVAPAPTGTGGGKMQSSIAGNPGSIGYVDPSKVQPVAATGPSAAFVQSVTSSVKAPQFVYPTIAAVKASFANIAPPILGKPASAWGAALNKTFFRAKSGSYPIVGLTYLVGYQCYAKDSSNDNYDGVLGLVNFFATNASAEAILESKGLVGLGVDPTTNADGRNFLQAELAYLTDTTDAAALAGVAPNQYPKTALVGLLSSQSGDFDVKNAKGVVVKHVAGPAACKGYFDDNNRT